MIGGVTRRMLSHLSGVPHLHVNRPLEVGNNKGAQSNQLHWEHFSNTLGPRYANILLSVKNQFIYLVVWLCVFEYMITMLDFLLFLQMVHNLRREFRKTIHYMYSLPISAGALFKIHFWYLNVTCFTSKVLPLTLWRTGGEGHPSKLLLDLFPRGVKHQHLTFSVAVRSSLAQILRQVQWWWAAMVMRYDVISTRWSSHFWVKIHVFFNFFQQ